MACRKGVGKTETFRLVDELGCLGGRKRDRGCPGGRKRDDDVLKEERGTGGVLE
jgi:hypothetical protein